MTALALVADFDSERVLALAGVPVQIDDDSVALAMTEVISRSRHVFIPPACYARAGAAVCVVAVGAGCRYAWPKPWRQLG
jgi:hypothetical protein